jgi:site-specific DNA-cytosine methylase
VTEHVFTIAHWAAPVHSVVAEGTVRNTWSSVADPRTGERFRGSMGVLDWDETSGVVTGNGRVPSGRNAVADPRLTCEPRAGAYRVLSWEEAAATITGSLAVDNGAAAVADPRLDPDKPPPFLPLIVAADGTWHRPLTTLELAALQGFPVEVDGSPLVLAGISHTRWREAIGNAIPPPAARAVGEQLLLALLVSKLGVWAMNVGDVWVAPPTEPQHEEVVDAR